MKLHIGAGSIYLEGYLNVDAFGTLAPNVYTNPNVTTLEAYYKRPFSRDPDGRYKSVPIVDMIMDIHDPWPFDDGSVDEVLMICCIEHHSLQWATFIVNEVKRVLKKKGRFLFDFPDVKKDFQLYFKKDPEFFFELVYCNSKNEFSVHRWGYTLETAKLLLGEGWRVKKKTIVKHDYPMIGVEAVKL